MIEHVKPTARIPAVQGQFGVRLVTYTTQLPAGAIETILGHDPRSRHWRQLSDDVRDIYEKLQRATTPKRLEQIVRYIRYQFIERGVILGAFPAISIAVEQPTEFEPYSGISDSGVGVLHFDLSRRNRRIMVDGLGRASAAMELVELSEFIRIELGSSRGSSKARFRVFAAHGLLRPGAGSKAPDDRRDGTALSRLQL